MQSLEITEIFEDIALLIIATADSLSLLLFLDIELLSFLSETKFFKLIFTTALLLFRNLPVTIFDGLLWALSLL